MMRLWRNVLLACLMATPLFVSGCAKTMIDRAIEARTAEDIKKDNQIVIDVNRAMADLRTVSASTTIYEQELLITGLFEDKTVYNQFRSAVANLEGVRKLHWHVSYLSETEREKRSDILSWDEVMLVATKAEARLIGTRDVADVNFRVTADSFGTVYLMGRARSKPELDAAIARVQEGDGVKNVVSYAFVRP